MTDAFIPEGELVDPEARPLTDTVIAPGWALLYAAGVVLFNVALQAGARSEAVIAPMRAAISVPGTAGSESTLAVALLSAGFTVGSYALMLLPALAIVIAARRRGVTFAGAVGFRRFSPGQTLGLALAVTIAGLFGVGVYSIAAAAVGITVKGNTAELVSGFGTGEIEVAIVFALVGIVAPIVEEITFRGIIYPSLRASWGGVPALLVSGVLFGVVHLQPTIAPPLAVIGMALALVFVRTRSLWSAVIAHCTFNTVSLALAFFVASQTAPGGGPGLS